MDGKTLANVAQYLLAARRAEAYRLSEIHEYVKNRVLDIYVPKKATDEYKKLVDQSRFNILPLLVNSLANNFFIDGYRSGRKTRENSPVWDAVWQPNRLDARQAGLWRPALQYGFSYATVLPGKLNGKDSAVITPWSPRRVTALYEDPINDEWCRYFLTVGTARPTFTDKGTEMVTPISVYDDHWRYTLDMPAGMVATQVYTPQGFGQPWTAEIQVNTDKVKAEEHGLNVPPLVRFMDSFGDMDDGPEGVVWPMLPAQRQLNQTTFGLGMAELYSAFKQRWVAGLELQEDENGTPIEPFNIAVDRLLQAEDADTKFGEFGQTDLTGYLDSRDKTLLFIASVRQIPPHTLVVGNAVSNISAEALAALEAGHQQDIAEHKTSFGESAEQMMRLAGKAMGDTAAWEDTSAQVRWRDTTPRSLAQVADALGKIATMLQVPPEELWAMLPDTTDQDIARWTATKAANDAKADSMAKLGGILSDAQSRGQRAIAAAPSAAGGSGGARSSGRAPAGASS